MSIGENTMSRQERDKGLPPLPSILPLSPLGQQVSPSSTKNKGKGKEKSVNEDGLVFVDDYWSFLPSVTLRGRCDSKEWRRSFCPLHSLDGIPYINYTMLSLTFTIDTHHRWKRFTSHLELKNLPLYLFQTTLLNREVTSPPLWPRQLDRVATTRHISKLTPAQPLLPHTVVKAQRPSQPYLPVHPYRVCAKGRPDNPSLSSLLLPLYKGMIPAWILSLRPQEWLLLRHSDLLMSLDSRTQTIEMLVTINKNLNMGHHRFRSDVRNLQEHYLPRI